tara:strand:- start:46 stop:192 length:147 start_codon:yes stop_codon:yes gene_type:complete
LKLAIELEHPQDGNMPLRFESKQLEEWEEPAAQKAKGSGGNLVTSLFV